MVAQVPATQQTNVSSSVVNEYAEVQEYLKQNGQLAQPPNDVQHVLARTQALIEHNGGNAFLMSSSILYNKILLGKPFVFASIPIKRHKETRTVPITDEYGHATTVVIPEMDVANCYVYLYDQETSQFSDMLLAELQGAWLLPQLFGLTENQLFGHFWTIGKNNMKEGAPWMLRLWDGQEDGIHQTIKRKEQALGNPATVNNVMSGGMRAQFPTSNTGTLPVGPRPGSGTLSHIRQGSFNTSGETVGQYAEEKPEPKRRGRKPRVYAGE